MPEPTPILTNNPEGDFTMLADGNLVCSTCGSLIHPQWKGTHDLWHDNLVSEYNKLAKNVHALMRAAQRYVDSVADDA